MNRIWWLMLPVVVLAATGEIKAVSPVMTSKSPVTDELKYEDNLKMVGCQWCGLSCVRADLDLNCVMLAPPEGKRCVMEAYECKVVDEGKAVVTPKQKEIMREPVKKYEKNVSPTKCKNSWWIDDKSSECKQKEFCGVYMYKGLRIFDSKEECQKVLDKGNVCGRCGENPRKRGDADCNDKIDISDFSIWKSDYLGGKTRSPGLVSGSGGDFNCDMKVSLDDFWIWRGEFIKSKLLK